jgi:membrane-bound metal-dependent hydrolase YbcI (DUF457 family)
MFVGHTALALAAKARAPRTSLGLLWAAAVTLDLLWPPFLLLGLEQVRIAPGDTAFTPLAFDSYPWSHSLLMALVWGVLLATLVARRGAAPGVPLLVGALVVSHWVLDFVSHRPDMPLWPGASPRLGLGLWNSIPGTLLVEGALFVAGIVIYLRVTRSRDAIGSWGFWGFVIVQAVLWASGPWSALPPSADAVAWLSLGAWLFVLWASWADRHREARATAP